MLTDHLLEEAREKMDKIVHLLAEEEVVEVEANLEKVMIEVQLEVNIEVVIEEIIKHAETPEEVEMEREEEEVEMEREEEEVEMVKSIEEPENHLTKTLGNGNSNKLQDLNLNKLKSKLIQYCQTFLKKMIC
jgi:hypothetical protein